MPLSVDNPGYCEPMYFRKSVSMIVGKLRRWVDGRKLSQPVARATRIGAVPHW